MNSEEKNIKSLFEFLIQNFILFNIKKWFTKTKSMNNWYFCFIT